MKNSSSKRAILECRKFRYHFLTISLLLILISVSNCFDRLILKSWCDPKTFTTANYFNVFNLKAQTQEKGNYITCGIEKFFGPFQEYTLIANEHMMINPHNRIFGEFTILFLNVNPSQFHFDKFDIYVRLMPEAQGLITEIREISAPSVCSGYPSVSNAAYTVQFSIKHTEYHNYDGYDLEIQVPIGGKADFWAISQLIVSGSFCRSDCDGCINNVDVCTQCKKNMSLLYGSCQCFPGYQIYDLSPTQCAQSTPALAIQDICYLEFINYIFKSFITTQCEFVTDKLQCLVNTTQGYPIRNECAKDGIYSFCYSKENTDPFTKTKLPFNMTCFNQTNSNNIIINTEKMQTTILIPMSLLPSFVLNSTTFVPRTKITQYNFTLQYNHQKNKAIHTDKPFKNHTWETIVMHKDYASPVIFDLFAKENVANDQFVPMVYVCTDSSCLTEKTLQTFQDKEYIYFRVYSYFKVDGYNLDVIELKLISYENGKVFDMKSELHTVQKTDFNCIYQVKVDYDATQRRFLTSSMDYDSQTDNGRVFIKIGLVSKLSSSNLLLNHENNQPIASQHRVLPVGDLWNTMDADWGMNLLD